MIGDDGVTMENMEDVGPLHQFMMTHFETQSKARKKNKNKVVVRVANVLSEESKKIITRMDAFVAVDDALQALYGSVDFLSSHHNVDCPPAKWSMDGKLYALKVQTGKRSKGRHGTVAFAIDCSTGSSQLPWTDKDFEGIELIISLSLPSLELIY